MRWVSFQVLVTVLIKLDKQIDLKIITDCFNFENLAFMVENQDK